jgi:hypothetical protein
MENLTEEEIQKKLARLAKIDMSSKRRLKNYLDKKRNEGCRTISAIVSGETYELINNERSRAALTGKPLSVSDIIEQAVKIAFKPAVNETLKENVAFTPAIIDSIGAGCTEGTNQDKIDCLFSEVQEMLDTPPPEQSLSLSPVDEVPFSLQGKDTNQELPENLAIPTQGQHSSEPVNILSRIAEMKAQKISYEKMADIFNSEGLKTQRGKDFTRANIEAFYRRGGANNDGLQF